MYLTQLEPRIVYAGGDPDVLRSQASAKKLWRPTVVMLVCAEGQWLVIDQLKKRVSEGATEQSLLRPALPQGGVEDSDESVRAAVHRELMEEVNLHKEYTTSVRFVAHSAVPFDGHNMGRDDFRLGKLLLVHVVRIAQQYFVTPNREDNVEAVHWLDDPAQHFIRPDGRKRNKYHLLTDPIITNAMEAELKRR